MDPSEEDKIAGFHEDNGFPWTTSPGDPGMIVEYEVRGLPSKIVLDSDGVIVHKPRAGARGEAEWRQLLDELAAEAAS